jgi:hypothetical protein
MTPEQMRELADRLSDPCSPDDDDLETVADFLRQCAEQRPCTCHPDDNPPVPCAQKYALNECRAASEPTETEIEARDALLDFISENGTASEGVQHYLDRYVRAALAAKE